MTGKDEEDRFGVHQLELHWAVSVYLLHWTHYCGLALAERITFLSTFLWRKPHINVLKIEPECNFEALYLLVDTIFMFLCSVRKKLEVVSQANAN